MGDRRILIHKKISLFTKGILVSLCAVAMMGAFALSAQAAENLDDWEVQIASGNPRLTPHGTAVEVSANGAGGTEQGNLVIDITGDVGVLAEINVSKMEGNDAICGLSKFLGTTPSGTYIQALIDVSQFEQWNTIRYRVREMDSNFAEVRVLVYGYLGNYKDGWSIGGNALIGLARLGDDIYFATPANGAFVKVQTFEGMGDMDATTRIYVWAGSGANSIQATVSNVELF
jgi:hypothetical protein